MADLFLRVLLVDDDPVERGLLKANLGHRPGVEIVCASSCDDALDCLSVGDWDAVMTDVVMPGASGIDLVRRIRETDTRMPIFVYTANPVIDGVVESVRAGATDFLVKPIDPASVISRLREAVRDRGAGAPIAERPEGDPTGILGAHPRLDEVREFARRIAAIPFGRVLITGASGTGKSLLAAAIHELSETRGEFVVVNCAALPDNLLESELFGHEEGAYTDARELKRGLIELAHDGTLFLDEIGAMPLALQAKLLLFLESQEVRRLGGMRTRHVRTRVIAATNEKLRTRVRNRTFRADLLYRLDVASIELPSLREMPCVIPELAQRFIADFAVQYGWRVPTLDPACLPELNAYPWPGNVRELRNVVERAMIFHDDGALILAPPSVPTVAPDAGVQIPYGLTLEEVERRYIASTMQAFPEIDYVRLAAQFNIARKTLWDKRRKYGL